MPSPCGCRACASYEQGYRQGYEAGRREAGKLNSDQINEAYRAGYNAHAASRHYAEAVYGPYTQHGKGENP